jgi:hypothetical protein
MPWALGECSATSIYFELESSHSSIRPDIEASLHLQRGGNVKSTFIKRVLGLAVCFMAVSAISEPSAAESIENQCRAAIRAELKGPNCRVANPGDNNLNVDPCGIPTTSNQMTVYTDKVVACVARGGPGRAAR